MQLIVIVFLLIVALMIAGFSAGPLPSAVRLLDRRTPGDPGH